MNIDPKEKKEEQPVSAPKEQSEEKQQQSDPQLTELKGLTDKDEPIEVEGTDNDV